MMNPSIATRQSPSFSVTSRVFIGRSIRHSLRNIEALVMAIMLPVMLMLLFTYVFGGALDPNGHYVNYVVPGIIVLCAGFGSSSTAVDVTDDMTGGIIDRFRTMPIRSMNVVTGHVVASLARNLMATGVVIGVALLVGFRTDVGILAWLAAIGVIGLYIFAFTWLFAAVGMVAGSPAAASGYGFVLLFLPYLSSGFVPTNTMPAWLRGVANYQPVSPVIETIRSLLTGVPIHHALWWSIAWCLFITLGSIIWSVVVFRKKAGRR